MRMHRKLAAAVAAVFALAGFAACSVPGDRPAAPATDAASASASQSLEALIAGLQRSADDRVRDRTSRAADVLSFFGVQPGWHVLDLFAGNGYYSELLSHAVGPTGRVYLHNNAAYLQFTDKLDTRLADGRLANVVRYDREIGAFDLPAGSVDMVLLVMAYHDLYYVTDGWNVTAGPLFAMVRRVLKPGGVLAIVDHHAQPGTGSAEAQRLHRIDAAFAWRDIESHGFRFGARSDVLENPEDDLKTLVFDEAIRGRTSRFVFRFEKP